MGGGWRGLWRGAGTTLLTAFLPLPLPHLAVPLLLRSRHMLAGQSLTQAFSERGGKGRNRRCAGRQHQASHLVYTHHMPACLPATVLDGGRDRPSDGSTASSSSSSSSSSGQGILSTLRTLMSKVRAVPCPPIHPSIDNDINIVTKPNQLCPPHHPSVRPSRFHPSTSTPNHIPPHHRTGCGRWRAGGRPWPGARSPPSPACSPPAPPSTSASARDRGR